jgi:predicted permease
MTRFRLWLRSVLFRRRLEREMQAEMAEHIERSTERLIARGLSAREARREAMREFGNVTFLQEEGRMARGTAGFDALLGDLRFAVRHFARHPLSTLTIIAVLSVGIGIDVVLFTLVYSFTGRPPSGIEASDALVRIRGSRIGLSERVERAFTLEEVEAFAGLEDRFSAVAAWTSQPVTAGRPGIEEMTVTATFVTKDYFDVLGVRPDLGSGLVEGEAAQVAVLSHAAWTRSFGEDPGVLGRTITLNDVPFTIVGVAPPLFRGAYWEARDDMQVWLPLASHRRVFPGVSGDDELFRAIARLRPGVTRESASAAVEVVAGRIMAERDRAEDRDASARDRDPSAEVVPLLADNLEPAFEANARFVKLAFGVLGLLTLLVTCANVSSLQTGLALARRRELAIRMSLGAARVRVIRQLVTESLLVATLAAGAAIGVTFAIIRLILAIAGSLSFELVFDGKTLVFTFGVALAAGLLFGLSPALHATRVTIAGLKDTAGAIAGGRARLQRGLVVAQIALTQPLAVCIATLVVFGIIEFRENPPSPYGDRIVLLRLASSGARDIEYAGDVAAAERDRRERDRLVEALGRVPGVSSAVWYPNRVPVSRAAFTLPDAARARRDDGEPFFVSARTVPPGYLDLMGIPILLGRDFASSDSARTRAVATPAIIGDDMARKVWRGGNPIGRRVERVTDAEEEMTLEVVGVYEQAVDAAGHSRDNFTVFLPPDPNAVARSTGGYIMLRTASPRRVMPPIRQVVRDEAPRAAITDLRTLAAVEDRERFTLWGGIILFSTGGLIVLLLSALGLYAVVAFAVGQRIGEIAVRMAIGARGRQIVGQFASDGLRLTALGIALGLPLSVLGLKAILSLSPDVPDVSLPFVTAVVAAGVLGVSALASSIPARRAAGIDPAAVLRRE